VQSLLEEIDARIHTFYGDAGGYDHQGTYDALDAHEQRFNQEEPIKTAIPPNLGFRKEQKTDSEKRKKNIRHKEKVGRQKWKTEIECGKRSGVENANYRYKTIVGRTLRAKNEENQTAEVQIGVRILNKMKSLGIPKARRSA